MNYALHVHLFFFRIFIVVLLFERTPFVICKGTLTQTLSKNNSVVQVDDGESASSLPMELFSTDSRTSDSRGQATPLITTPGITQSSHSVAGHSRGIEPLERTRPFAIVDGHRRSLKEVLKNGHPDTLICGLQVGGDLLLLDLEKNQDLLPVPPNIFFYSPNGTRVSMQEGPVTHCYYHGSVRGFSHSRVAVSSCAGLRGVIVVNASLSFELQPDEEEEQGEEGHGRSEEEMHLIYSVHQQSSGLGDCGVSPASIPPIQFIPHIHRSKRDILSETKYIELVLVADHKEYLNHQKNNKTLIYRMLDVANQVDWFYRPLNVRVALLGMEIWNDRDKILVDKSPTDTLNRFLDWRTRELLPRLRHDNAQLIIGESFDGSTVGMAAQSSMCSRDRSGGVNVDHLVSVLGVASTVAHELGHNLGMSHDTADRRCQCQNEPRLGGCIMEPSTGYMPGQLFSSCSEQDLSLSLLHGGGVCLFNVPQPEELLGGPRCGNLYVEKGEECDCGLLDECNDPCCNASTCKLVPGAQCSSDGICCENCKLRVAGWMCREPLGECDLPEYCSGMSPYCPANVFLQNGVPCQGGTSYCYGGMCASLDDQCQLLWGANSTRAPSLCFSTINKQGNKYGNCGQMRNGTYVPCSSADVHCGKLQCQGGYNRPLLGTNAEILTTKMRQNRTEFICRTYFDLGDDVSDPAMVAHGTSCAPGKACLDQRCQDVSMFGTEECHRKCNGHGVCNSNKNCHCDVGWAPPDCLYSGAGGSVDSGPLRQPRDSDPTRVTLLVFFLFVLPVSLLLLAFRFPRCRQSLFRFNNTPFTKARQPSRYVSVAYIEYWVKLPEEDLERTPAIERLSVRNGDQVQPLRYQWTPQNDIPLTRAISKAQDRPAPPTKPLPPDPVSKQLTQLAGQRPAPPNKPLPPDPAPSESKTQRKPTVTRPAAPSKPLPPDPVLSDRQLENPVPPRPPVPRKPLPADPCGYPTALPLHPLSQPAGFHAATAASSPFTTSAAAVPARRPPLPPVTAAHHPRRLHKPPQV